MADGAKLVVSCSTLGYAVAGATVDVSKFTLREFVTHLVPKSIVEAMAKKDGELAAKLMEEHLIFVENSLSFDKKVPTHDISLALS